MVDSGGNPLPGVNLVTYDAAAKDPAHLGLDASVGNVLNSMPLPNNYTTGDGLNIAGFSWLAAEHEKQLDYTIRVDHTFNDRHSLFVRWSAGHQNTIADTVNGGLPVFPGTADLVDTYRTPKNLAASWRWVMKSEDAKRVHGWIESLRFQFCQPGS